jgi:hypothetical protein
LSAGLLALNDPIRDARYTKTQGRIIRIKVMKRVDVARIQSRAVLVRVACFFNTENSAFFHANYLCILYDIHDRVGRDSSVGTAARYGLDCRGIESRWAARFSALVQTGSGAHPSSYIMGTGSFPGLRRPERGVNHSSQSGIEVTERVELYFRFYGWSSGEIYY